MSTRHEANEAAIRQRIDAVIEGIEGKDLDTLRRSYAPDVVSFDVEPPLQHVGVDAKLKNWERAFAMLDDLHYDTRELAVEAGDVVAFAHCFGRLRGTLADGTVTGGMWVRGTFCFRKVGDDWLIAHDQASVPLDFPTGRALTDLEP
jgi:ketosteroid isomerase-like protein